MNSRKRNQLLGLGAIIAGIIVVTTTSWMASSNENAPGSESAAPENFLEFEGVARPSEINESTWLALVTEFAIRRATNRSITARLQVVDQDGNPVSGVRLKLGLQQWQKDFSALVKTGKSWSETARTSETDSAGRLEISADKVSAIRLLQVRKEGYQPLLSGEVTLGAQPLDEIFAVGAGEGHGSKPRSIVVEHTIVLQDRSDLPTWLERHRHIVAALCPGEDVARLDAIAGWRWRKMEVTEVARTRGMKSSNKVNDRWDLEYSVRDDSSGPGCTLSIRANQGEIRLIDPTSARRFPGGSSDSFRPSLKIAFTEGEVSPGGQLLGFLEFRTRKGKVWGTARPELRPHEDGRWIVDFREVEAGWVDGM